MSKKRSKSEVLILTEESLELWSRLFHEALFRISRGVFKYRVSDADLMRKYSTQGYVQAARDEFSTLLTHAYCGVPLDDISIVSIDEERPNLKVVNTYWREDRMIYEVVREPHRQTYGVNAFLSPLERAEKRTIEQYMKLERGVKNRVRKALGITVNTLNAKIEKYGISMQGVV